MTFSPAVRCRNGCRVSCARILARQLTYRDHGRMISAGDRVRAVDAFGHWHPGIAETGVEGTHRGGGRKVHDFPVIWVVLDGYPGQVPWPRSRSSPTTKLPGANTNIFDRGRNARDVQIFRGGWRCGDGWRISSGLRQSIP